MKKTFLYAIAAVAAIATVSCQKFETANETPVDNEETIVTITGEASTINGAKSTIDDKVTKWVLNDEILLVATTNGKTDNLKVTEIANEGRTATFYGTCSNLKKNNSATAIYPSDASYTKDLENNVTVNAKSTQDGSFAKANICTASCTLSETKGNSNLYGKTMYFSNQTAILKFTQSTKGIYKIDITAANNIAGTSNTITANFDQSTTEVYIAIDPVETGAISFSFNNGTPIQMASKTLVKNTIYNMGNMDNIE